MINESELTVAYFKHDTCPRSDIEIMKLLNKYGAEGYGIFWILIELLHQNNNKLYAEDIKTIIEAYDLTENITHSVLNDFKLFKNNNEYYYSERVGRNLEVQVRLRENKLKAIYSRWSKDKEKKAIQTFYIEEYKKVFNEEPTMMPDEINTLYELSKTNSNFEEKLPITLRRLSKIKFDEKYRNTPLSSWLLKDNHFASVANGEFTKKQEEAIRNSITNQVKYESIELTEKEKQETDKVIQEGRKRLDAIKNRKIK